MMRLPALGTDFFYLQGDGPALSGGIFPQGADPGFVICPARQARTSSTRMEKETILKNDQALSG
jgi:hypothetical protein